MLITFLLLLVYRLGKHIPMPGLDAKEIIDFMARQTQGTLLSLYDMFTGGAFSHVTLFALGIMPYITSSIIIQMLVYVIPEFKKLHDEGERGHKVLTQYTRYGTILICILQSIAYAVWIRNLNLQQGQGIITIDPGLFTFVAILTFTTGTVFLMWLGETITEVGIGNGISLIILVGIIARIIPDTGQLAAKGAISIMQIVLLVVIIFIVTAASVLLTLGARKIPIMYPKRIQGRKIVQGARNYLPLRINSASVIPVIFAQSVLMIPATVQMVIKNEAVHTFIQKWMGPTTPLYIVLYFILTVLFTFFYTAITFNPEDVADNLQKYGGFIQGKRPGKVTADFLSTVLNRITFIGGLMLAIIAVLPQIIMQIFDLQGELAMLFGGTSLLIIVGVVLDTAQQIEGQLIMRHYEGFSKRRIKSRHI